MDESGVNVKEYIAHQPKYSTGSFGHSDVSHSGLKVNNAAHETSNSVAGLLEAAAELSRHASTLEKSVQRLLQLTATE